MNRTEREGEHALAYPEPPASPQHRHGVPAPRPLTPAQQRRNRELLALTIRNPLTATAHRRRSCSPT